MPNVDLLLITALDEERDYVLSAKRLKFESARQVSGHTAYPFRIERHDTEALRGVLVSCGAMGVTDAALMSEWGCRELSPSVIAILGIAGNLSSDLQIGDVVIAESADQYDHAGKVIDTDDGSFTWRAGGAGFNATQSITKGLRNLSKRYSGLVDQWSAEYSAVLNEIAKNAGPASALANRPPRIEVGPIASGSNVVASSRFKALLLRRNRKFLAVDMESAGMLKAVEALRPGGPKTIVIRSITDLADSGKELVDQLKGGALRRWGTVHTANLLALLLSNTDVVFPSSHAGGSADLLREQHDAVLDSFPMGRQPISNGSVTPEWSRLLVRIIAPGESEMGNTPVETIADLVTREERPLWIVGESGTGKTTLVSCLYLLLRDRHDADVNATLPLFVDVSQLTYKSDAARRDALTSRLNALSPIINERGERPCVILIDGLSDSSAPVRDPLLDVLSSLEVKNLRYVYSVTSTPADNQSEIPRSNSFTATRTVSLQSIPNSDADALIDAFAQSLAQSSTHASEIKAELARLGVTRVDLRTLAAIDAKRKSGIAGKPLSLGQTLFEFAARHASLPFDENLTAKAARQWYARAVDGRSDEIDRDDSVWKIIGNHAEIRDYLVAYALVEDFFQLPPKGRRKKIPPSVSRIYSHNVTRHARDIIRGRVDGEAKVMASAQYLLEKGDVKSRTNACYFLGRLQDSAYKKQAIGILRRAIQAYEARHEELDVLRLLRTTWVSLIFLQDPSASREYIAQLTKHRAWDELNRAFHLEYYGDLRLLPGVDPAHEDTLGSFPRNLARLRKRLSGDASSRRDSAYELDLYTLFSLALHRHAKGKLESNVREELLEHLDGVSVQDLESPDLRHFLRLCERDLGRTEFRPGAIVEDVLRLKDQPREGWRKRGLKHSDHVESVADHTMGAYLLGRLLLPDRGTSPGYDKRQVLDMVLIHDLAEAWTGDIVSPEKTDSHRDKENEWFEYLGLAGTYDGFADCSTIYSQWRAYDAKAEVNAQIAHEVQDLDMLVQLYRYTDRQDAPKPLLDEFEDWKEKIKAGINTKEGREICKTITEWFGLPARLKRGGS